MVSGFAALAFLACTEQGLTARDEVVQGEPDVRVQPASIELGPLSGGERAEAALQVESVGALGLTVHAMRLVDATPGLDLQVPPLPTVLPPGAALSALVSFEAHSTEAVGTIEIETDDPDSPLLTVPVSALADLAWLEIAPNPLELGVVIPGQVVDDAVSLSNRGNVELVVDTLVLLADHVELAAPPALPLTIGPGATLDLPVRYAPVDRAEENAQLWVGSTSWLGDAMGAIHGKGGWPGVQGRICDPSGAGWVIDAEVTAEIQIGDAPDQTWLATTRTDHDGYYTLQDVPPGLWTLNVRKGSYTATFEITVPEGGGLYELADPTCLDPDAVSLAIVTGEYDHVEHLVAELGLDYDAYGGTTGLRTLLNDPELLAQYDVLFLNCGDYRPMASDLALYADVLVQYVEAGGSVYASDWASLVVEAAWPELVDLYGYDSVFETTAVGVSTRQDVEVVDTILAYAVGSTTAEIVYDLDAWIVPVAPGAGVEVLARSTVPTFAGTQEDAPLALRVEPGGRIIFTTFHNEQQLTEDMEAALKEIILSL